MNNPLQNPQDYCFCTLALRPKYRQLTKELADSLVEYAPGVFLVVGTDDPEDFKGCENIQAFPLRQQGILHCYHDKRFVLREALQHFKTAIQIDADTRLTKPIVATIEPLKGLGALHIKKLAEHAQRYNPQRLPHLQKVSEKLNIPFESATYVGESLFALSQSPQVDEFIEAWGKIGRYLELRGIYSGSGNAIGLAATKVGLEIYPPNWLSEVRSSLKHFDASFEKRPMTAWQSWNRRLGYHYRLNKERITALKDFNFYYS